MNVNEVYQFMMKFDKDPAHAIQVGTLSLSLFDQLQDLHQCGANERLYLLCAAYLHDIGLTIRQKKHHVHSYLIVLNAEFPSFNPMEKQIVANITRYHRKAFPTTKHNGFAYLSDPDKQIVRKMSALLRLAIALDQSHEAYVSGLTCTIHEKQCQCVLSSTSNCLNELTQVIHDKKLFQHVFGLNFTIVDVKPETETTRFNTLSSTISIDRQPCLVEQGL